MQDGPGALSTAPLARRLLALLYESLLLVAVAFAATAALVIVAHLARWSLPRWLIQAYLVVAMGAYFVPQWRAGHTLAMRTWRMRLLDRSGRRPTTGQALLRYVLALAGLFLAGLGFFWALFDPDRQFLHDRLSGTRLVAVPRSPERGPDAPARPG